MESDGMEGQLRVAHELKDSLSTLAVSVTTGKPPDLSRALGVFISTTDSSNTLPISDTRPEANETHKALHKIKHCCLIQLLGCFHGLRHSKERGARDPC